jgi:hypothetical protein
MQYWMSRLRLQSVSAKLRVVVRPDGGKRRTLRRTVGITRS